METPREYFYTYYSYEEYGRGYIGSRKCYCLPEEDVKYFGSFKDKTFKPTQKIILKSDYATREEAYADEIILQEYYKVVENPHFTNKAYQTSIKFYTTREQCIENGRKGAQKARELGVGLYSRTKDQCIENGIKAHNYQKENMIGLYAMTKEEKTEYSKKGVQKLKELNIGLYALTFEQRSEHGKKLKVQRKGFHSLTKEQRSQFGKKGTEIARELGLGVYGLTFEQLSENGKKGGKIGAQRQKELNIGLYGLTFEQRSEVSKKIASQKWQCTVTGHISNAGGLATYQKARGIDTSKRIRIE